LSSDILTCRCRHCGKTFPYLKQEAGVTAECPECRNSVQLPGKLQGIATKRRVRVLSVPGILMEISGFLLMAWYPIGTIAGPALILVGWRNGNRLRCSNCDEPTDARATRCAKCRAAFSSD
jgi:hypothetical protein